MLFIGGSQDGKHMDAEHKTRLRFLVNNPIYRVPPPSESVQYDYYDEMEFMVEGKRYFIYKLETMTPREAFEALLDGYKSTK